MLRMADISKVMPPAVGSNLKGTHIKRGTFVVGCVVYELGIGDANDDVPAIFALST